MRKIIINSILMIGALLLFLYGAVEYKTQFAKTEILTSDSHDGHKLKIYMIGEPKWPFGSTKGRMELYDESGKLAKRNYILYDDGCEIIRIKPFDKEMLKWTKEVVAPIGYHGINILSCNWDKENMEEINFDACFEYFYFMKMGEKVDMDKYEDGIPERVYEDVLLTYLPIDADTLRKHVKYDRKKNIYEYSRMGYMNSSPRSFETSIPEVIEVVNLGDHKYKLIVNAIRDMQYHDVIFTHTLIIKKVGKNRYQYLSNMIIQDDPLEIPR